MLPPTLETPREVKQHYDLVYDQLIASGEYHPFLYPWATLGFGVIIIYLLLDHRKAPALRSLRFPLFGFLCAFSAWCILTNKARSPAASYGVGLVSAWGTLWTGAIMCFNDCQTDFKRIERAHGSASMKSTNVPNGGHVPNGRVKAADQSPSTGPAHRKGRLYWQPYPSTPFKDRLEWVIDIFCNFRGVGWNFGTHGIPPPPSWAQAELHDNSKEDICNPPTDPADEITTSTTGIRRFTSRRALLQNCLINLTIGFFALDLIKLIMHHDPYFWGYTTTSTAPLWLPPPIRASRILLKSYRLLTSLAGVSLALNEIFRLGPLFFCALLGPSRIGLRGAPWMNPPDFYGDFRAVLDKGLAGWWGSWWHQTFRFAFEAPGSALLAHLSIPKTSQKGKLLSLFIAFALSGSLHACGSHTQLGATRPLRGPCCFFLLQPLGILAQTLLLPYLPKKPHFLVRVYNFLFVMVWMYFTAPLLVDDFARGGVWLYEPLAFSPLRALGLGARDDGCWDLWYGLVFWRRGEGWWDTGIAF
ncbi:Hypothetical predicted protein [Lecanosticta acicola]|uniref:Wax synthase domain-containing protein n=1 Tax=Lecanosticta acicola TaxID=111012 RepID=A0AAI9E9I3_9PEZI|nr:Hypothetical predicted protein [Lecanosticta acicola]